MRMGTLPCKRETQDCKQVHNSACAFYTGDRCVAYTGLLVYTYSYTVHAAPLSLTMCAPCPSHPGPPAGTATANGVWCSMAQRRDE